jgi:hypothetical protein
VDVNAVRATVECHPRFMVAGLRRHQHDRVGGHIGCVDNQDVHLTPHGTGQRLVEVTFIHLAAGCGDVASGAPDRDGVEVHGVQLNPAYGRDQRGTHRTRTAAQVDDSPWPGTRIPGVESVGGGLVNKELGAAAGYEHSSVHSYPQTAELHPAKNVFQGLTGHSPIHHGSQLGRRLGRSEEQSRLVLGKDTADSSKPADDDGLRQR